MINVLILEDQSDSREALRLLLERYKNVKAHVAADMEGARELLDQKETNIDLFLLDINLNVEDEDDISGFKFAEEVRKDHRYEFTPIVMVTSVSNMEMSAYRRLHCYSFLVKPYLEEEIEELITKIKQHRAEETTDYIIVKKDGINYKVKCSEIVYIKAITRGVQLVLRKDEMTVPYTSIKQLMDKLPEKKFSQVHRMYVINASYIENVDIVNRIIKLQGKDEQIEIGVTYKEKVRRLLNE